MLAEYIEYNFVTPSLEQAIKLKELSRGGILREENIEKLLDVPKANQIQKFKISEDRLFNVVPKNIERDKNASIIREELEGLALDFRRYKERRDKLSRSIDTVTKDVKDINTTTDKITSKFNRISSGKVIKYEEPLELEENKED